MISLQLEQAYNRTRLCKVSSCVESSRMAAKYMRAIVRDARGGDAIAKSAAVAELLRGSRRLTVALRTTSEKERNGKHRPILVLHHAETA